MERLDHVKNEQVALKTRIMDDTARKQIIQKYKSAKEKLFFLDYDGTLTGFHTDPAEAKPDDELYKILNNLTKDENTNLVIISGRDKQTLQDWFDTNRMDLIGEHGVWLRQNGKDWETVTTLTDEWKPDIRKVLEGYVSRTPGSFIEEKDYSLVWHYRKVETGLGELRTRELTSHLKYLATNQNLQVLEGDMVVEFKSSEVNKGRAAKSWLKRYSPDFIMAIGDDWTDEDTFKAMPKDSFTIKVGSSHSEAKYSIGSPEEVRELLSRFFD